MWCDYQLACSDWPEGWACGAHLNEGHVFECPYAPVDVADVGNGRMKPCRDAATYRGVCEDYRPAEKASA